MTQNITRLQSLYWQKESLHDIRWSLDRKIHGLMKRNRKPHKLLAERADVILRIRSISVQMDIIEKRGSAYKHKEVAI